MNRVAFVFTHSPYGSSAGREGLDAVLATAALSESICLFFIGDGVLQLIPGQQPEIILTRNHAATFGVLDLYNIEQCVISREALKERGLAESSSYIIDVNILDAPELIAQLSTYNRIITF
ncbi:sulfurtransferase complex subunit TusC [Pantoea sp. Nvir]|uniref:sulfurtransferase complex subunit TusC n=1 Tax=Pantoea sp. Nvir TaxID=2576760 RepID=UPI00135C2D61|nr:sulfurtransferase complex subunit TusC [Pantoea sp. Nvir]MXP66919.1 sulfurtransferase complex subunit TusC [Pantoea sp. Nvir]